MRVMDDRALAQQVEAMKDDPDAWGGPESTEAPGRKRKSERRQRGAVVSVRLSAEELEALQRYADERGMALSSVLREYGLRAASARQDLEPRPDRPADIAHRLRTVVARTYNSQDPSSGGLTISISGSAAVVAASST